MTDPAAQISKEAKGLHQGLKESLKTRDVSDREVDIQRKNLRRQYLRLLFVHPYARESKDAETHLWMQTSYSLISIYKQRIAALDRTIHSRPGAPQQHQQPSRVVEYRRLLQRFRQFLSEEEKFWTQLVLRLCRHFALDECQSTLDTLGIVPEEEPVPSVDGGAPRRSQFQFPPESEAGSSFASAVIPTNQSQRESRTAILSKALVCLGDIARYKEQYNEAGGRPRAGHEDGPPASASAGRNGRGRRGGGPGQANGFMALPRLRNYDRAQSCYEQARLLLPFDGNPSHQLAILSSYQKDIFGSLVHYYRALCVRTPYETASENLGTVLNKALDQYNSKGLIREQEKQNEAANGASAVPRLRVEAFKEKVVVLHAFWCTNIDEAKTLGEKVVEDFASLVADRILPIDMISKVIILVQGALWKHRMLRRPVNGEKRSNRISSTESHIVTHLIAIHRVLLENGSVELTEAPPEDAAEHDLAQRITATFRRTLPALRMAGKWLRSNTRYISQGRKSLNGHTDEGSKEGNKGKERRNGNASAVVVGDIRAFWAEYVRFCDMLIHAFPMDQLPELKTQLEEDVELAGFLPLRKYMYGSDGKPPGSRRASTDPGLDGKANGESKQVLQDRLVGRDQVHPNEEQLMRLSDILCDAKAVAEDENTPILFLNGSFVPKDEDAVAAAALNSHRTSNGNHSAIIGDVSHTLRQAEPEDDNISITTRTEDDILREAMLHVIDGSDDDEEVIVWQPSASLSPQQDPVFTALPTTPPKMSPIGTGANSRSPRRADELSPIFKQMDLDRSPPLPPPTGIQSTTAQDLLNNVMGITRTPAVTQHSRGPSIGPVNLLFGSGGPGNSIWSPTADSTPTTQYNRNPVGLGNGLSYPTQSAQPLAPSLPLSQSTLASSQPWQPTPTTNILPSHLNGPISASFAPPHTLNSPHQRVPSESLVPLRSLPPSLPSQRHYESLNTPAIYNSLAALDEPSGVPHNSLLGRSPAPGFNGSPYSSPPALGNYNYLRQAQADLYTNFSPSQLPPRRETGFHAPFHAPSISNIWGSPG